MKIDKNDRKTYRNCNYCFNEAPTHIFDSMTLLYLIVNAKCKPLKMTKLCPYHLAYFYFSKDHGHHQRYVLDPSQINERKNQRKIKCYMNIRDEYTFKKMLHLL